MSESPVESSEAQPAKAASGALAGVLFLFTWVCCVALGGVLFGGTGKIVGMVQDSGPFAYGAIFVSLLGMLVGLISCLLSARGRAVPVLLPFFFACLPWAVGLVGMVRGQVLVESAVSFVRSSNVATLAAAGVGEMLGPRTLGLWLTASLITAVCVGWGASGFSRRAPKRAWWTVAAVFVFGVIGTIGAFLMLRELRTPPVAAVYAITCFMALGALLGLVGIGADSKLRSGALGVGAIFFAWQAGQLAVLGARSFFMGEAYGVVAHAAPDSLAAMVGANAISENMFRFAGWGSFAIAFVAMLFALGLAFRRSKPKTSAIVVGAIALFLVLAYHSVDRLLVGRAQSLHAHAAQLPFEHHGFTPASIDAGDRGMPNLLLSTTQLSPTSTGSAVGVSDEAGIARLLHATVPPPVSDPFAEPDIEVPPEEQTGPRPKPFVALGEEVKGSHLRPLLTSAAASAFAVRLCGRSGTPPERARGYGAPEWALPLVDGAACIKVIPGRPDPEDEVVRRTLPTGGVVDGPRVDSSATVWVAFPDDISAGALLAGLGELRRAREIYLASTSELPAVQVPQAAQVDPTRQLLDVLGGDAVGTRIGQTLGLGQRLGVTSTARRVGRVRFGQVSVEGPFDPSVITRKVRARQSAFKRCYETSLRDNAELAGDVTIAFAIREQGSVTRAEAVDSSLRSPALERCVVGVMRRLRWSPGPSAQTRVRYPMSFSSIPRIPSETAQADVCALVRCARPMTCATKQCPNNDCVETQTRCCGTQATCGHAAHMGAGGS